MNKVPELLVPAGGMEQLKAAAASGADAVYIGGRSFSARSHAANFSDEEMAEAIEYAHSCDVKIHAALNTLLKDRELPGALEYAARLYGLGADAVIVQDTGLFSMIHQYLPDLSLHLSTQGTVTDLSGVREAAARGAERVILARELSLEEIRRICREKENTEIEIFVHGAICIGLSGQCHMSGMIGGRSGNRGDCAQPCRMTWSLGTTDGYRSAAGCHLSPKDLCLLGHLKEIAEAGVDSIKIEGRMKSPEYVAAVTSIYRKHLDFVRDGKSSEAAACLEEDVKVLRQMYSRGSFTDTYFRGSAYVDLMSGRSPKHQGLYIGKTEAYYKKPGHALVRLADALSVGDGVEIRGKRGTADNVVTFIKDSRGKICREAEKGDLVEIGDLRVKGSAPEKGAPVFRLTDKKLSQKIRDIYDKMPQRLPVRFRLQAVEGKRLFLQGTDCSSVNSSGDCAFIAEAFSEDILQTAKSAPPDEKRLAGRLAKTGGTPYLCTECQIEIEGEPHIPASVLNELRRQVLEQITEQRLSASRPSAEEAETAMRRVRQALQERKIFEDNPAESTQKDRTVWIMLYFYDAKDLGPRIREILALFRMRQSGEHDSEKKILFCLPSEYFMDSEKAKETAALIAEAGCCFDLVMPLQRRRTELQEEKVLRLFEEVRSWKNFRAVMVGDAGQISLASSCGIPFELDSQMNILNEKSAAFWLSGNARSVTLSDEPDPEESSSFHWRDGEYCVNLYGRIPVMYLEHCPVGCSSDRIWSGDGNKNDPGAPIIKPSCSKEKKYYYCRTGEWLLRDRKGAEFPVKADSSCCRAVVYSHRKLNRLSKYAGLLKKGCRHFRISIFDESAEEIQKILEELGK